jgi:hypothetical protein
MWLFAIKISHIGLKYFFFYFSPVCSMSNPAWHPLFYYSHCFASGVSVLKYELKMLFLSAITNTKECVLYVDMWWTVNNSSVDGTVREITRISIPWWYKWKYRLMSEVPRQRGMKKKMTVARLGNKKVLPFNFCLVIKVAREIVWPLIE